MVHMPMGCCAFILLKRMEVLHVCGYYGCVKHFFFSILTKSTFEIFLHVLEQELLEMPYSVYFYNIYYSPLFNNKHQLNVRN